MRGTPETAVLPLGLPGLPFHLRLDPLSAFFLLVLGSASAGVSAFASGYFRKGEGTPPGLLCLLYHLFLASMAMVLLADDAYVFMVMWELMALSSFFLVTANHVIPEIRRAGYLYLLIAHIGALAILLCFGVLQANTGDYTFANMRAQELTPFWASVAFLLAFFGFGAKAGIVPLHIWLPEAHPAAPSPVSALMSGVMLKTAIYGLLRIGFEVLQTQLWWWGVLALAIGLMTALFGVVFAAIQTDMKRLLAYSSIENIGLLVVGIGLALLFVSYGMAPMAALALTAVLYHALNHAFFKSLLFLGTGAVLHATGERNLGKLGGLLRFMPWVGWLSLAGALAAAGLPPLNGFVSEWLLLQSFLFTLGLKSTFVNNLVPVVAAGIALVAAIGGYVMVKFFGVIFLGQPREARLAASHDAVSWERAGLVWLAIGCVVARPVPRPGHCADRPGHTDPGRRRHWPAGRGPRVAHPRSGRPGPRQLQPVAVPAADGDELRTRVRARALALPRSRAARRAVGLWLPAADCAHAGHRRGLRAADPPGVRTLLPHRAAPADAVRQAALLPPRRRRSLLALAVPAGGAPDRGDVAPGRNAAAGPDLDLPDVQLRHAAGDAGAGVPMTVYNVLAQVLAILLAVLGAPLLTGWVNQCRAWLQNKSAPPLLLPYRTLHKLFWKESVVAENASPLFRIAPYIIFGAMVLACSIVPSLSTDLLLAPAADAIALVGLFALARAFIALAAMDIGTAFGTLGARREMLVGFLAEPALLMVLFTAAFLTQSTSLANIVETIANQPFAIYPSLAFAGVAFTMVALAENARVPVDNPATHLELTMIHEAMILEYSGRHLALVEWAASLKLFAYSSIGLAIFFPWGIAHGHDPLGMLLAAPALILKLAIGGAVLALIETMSAKMRIFRVPEFLAGAFLLAVIGILVHFLLGA